MPAASSNDKFSDFAFAAAAIVLWLVTGAIMTYALPLLPIDETRYLTVAWEMNQSGNWLLPTLNGEPYSHKPPLLFWLVNTAWALGGIEIWAARAVSILATAGALFMTYCAGKVLYPDRPGVPSLAVLLLTAGPIFLLYGNVIMFDILLTVWVLAGLLALWQLADEPSWKNALLLGIAIGLGLLTKGPVILLHLGPPAALIRFWRPDGFNLSAGQWWKYLFGSVLIGAAMILAWAIPAAIVGGPEFARMIFWKQSAGRMVNSFDHARPFWFYIPVLAAFLLPFFFWRPLWRGLRTLDRATLPRSNVFLLTWIVPAFVVFSALSGKQPHYLLPLLPGLALIAAGVLDGRELRARDALLLCIPFALLFLAVALGPVLAAAFPKIGAAAPNVRSGVTEMNPAWFLVAGLAALAALFALRTSIHRQALAMSIASALFVANLGLQCHSGVFRYYDLAPVAAALQPFEKGPVAFLNKYEGEIGFLARLKKPIEIVANRELDSWSKAHPDGTLLQRDRTADGVAGYSVIFSQPYRSKEFVSVMRPVTAGAALKQP